MKRNTSFLLSALSVAALSLSAGSALAQVQDVTAMTGQITGQLVSLGELAGVVAFLMGFVFGIMGFLKLKANAQNPQDPSNKPSTAFMLIFIGAGLIAVPTVMGVGVNSLFSSGANTTALEQGGGGFTAIK